jgi:outer membrane protein assembly factor BamB
LVDLGASWNRQTMASIVAAPVFDESHVYFANTDGRVFASSYRARRTDWDFRTSGAVVADLKLTAGGLLLVASRDYSLYALNAASGLVAWRTLMGDPLEKTPRPVGDRVYVIKKGGDLLALDERTGQTVWTAKGLEEFVAASPETLFMLSRGGRIAALSPADGSIKYTLGLGRLKLVAVNEIDGQLFLASSDGHVVALREVKVEYERSATPAAAPAAAVAPTPAPALPPKPAP